VLHTRSVSVTRDLAGRKHRGKASENVRHPLLDLGETETVFAFGIDLVNPILWNRAEVLDDAMFERDSLNLATERDRVFTQIRGGSPRL
jgi:hypothetical protein